MQCTSGIFLILNLYLVVGVLHTAQGQHHFGLQDSALTTGQIHRLENLYFDFDRAKIQKDCYGVMDSVADFLVQHDSLQVEIACHMDQRGNDRYCMNLTQKRAESMKDYLVAKGINAKRIIAKGYGESHPLVDCTHQAFDCDETHHQLNRRIEIHILSTQNWHD